jgi:hypothetical protein
MRIYIIITLVLVSLAACKDSKSSKYIIPPEKMVPVLMDMHLTYALQSSSELRKLAREVDSVDVYSYVFNKHNISRIRFDSTIAWYSRNPELFTDIYDQVIMQLTQLKDSITPSFDD